MALLATSNAKLFGIARYIPFQEDGVCVFCYRTGLLVYIYHVHETNDGIRLEVGFPYRV